MHRAYFKSTFESYILQAATDTNAQAVESRMTELKSKFGYTDDVAREEIAAEFAESFFGDKGSIDSFVKENPTLADKVLDAIKSAKAGIKTATSSPFTSRMGVEVTYSQLNKAEKLWSSALKSATESQTAADNGEVRYSIAEIKGKNGDYGQGVILDTNLFKNTKPRNWNRILSKYVYNNLAGEDIEVYDGNNSEVISFAKKGERVTKDGMNSNHRVIDKLARTRGNSSILGVVHIDELLQTAQADVSNTENNHKWLDENGWEFKKAYMQDKNGNIYETTLNIAKAHDGRKILYSLSNTKKIDVGDVSSTRKTQEGLAHNHLSSDNSISNSEENVKYSAKENSENNAAQTKTDAFKAWFGDWESDPEGASKVVNEDGTPKVVYHGTNSSFTVFDREKYNSNEPSGDYVGEGFYFSNSKYTARKYGNNVMPVYLEIKNPITINTEQDAKNFRNQFYGMYSAGKQELRDLIGGDYDYFEIIEENPSEIRDFLQKQGYDGLIDNLYGQYAVFNPEQIKSATDNVGTFDKNNPDVRYSMKEGTDEGKITADMSDEERAEILKNTNIKLAEYTGNSEHLSEEKITQLQNTYRKQAGKTLRELGDKFGVFKGYSNENVELDFNYSHNSLNESVHKQGNISNDYSDFAKMLYVFDDVVNNAVPIAVNTDKYTGTIKENQNLKYDYVLLSAFEDGNNIVPVEFHIKEFNDNSVDNNKLHVSITLGKIKSENTVLVHPPVVSNETQTNYTRAFSDEISIPDLLKEVNPEYGNFYKYIPSELLSDKQNASKGIAVKDEDYRLKVLRGEDVSDMLKAKAAENGYSADGEDNSKTLDVTYDDGGNIIPLSKRFDKNNPDVRYSAKEGNAGKSIKEEINNASDILNNSEPVFVQDNIYVKDKGRSGNLKDIMEIFKAYDYKVERKGVGTILIDKNRVSNSLRYLKSEGELAAYSALPNVLKDGIEINSNSNHKQRGYITLTIAAPVEINGQRGNMAAVIRQEDGKNYYKVHRLLMPDGSTFEYKNKDSAERAAAESQGETVDTPAVTVFDNRVPQNDGDVKYSMKENLETENEEAYSEESWESLEESEPSENTALKAIMAEKGVSSPSELMPNTVTRSQSKIKSEDTVFAQSADQMNGQQSSARVSSDTVS
ncbi:MAG: hypothetical protein LUF26_05810, partial [Firmicutes bacterium]|nr:hypothetical protein [Bacillota bacterium]